MDRAAARLRKEARQKEARGDAVAGQRLCDDDAQDGFCLALRERLGEQTRPIARPGRLAPRIARSARQPPAIRAASVTGNRFLHVPAPFDIDVHYMF
jgi:hypothetical protein